MSTRTESTIDRRFSSLSSFGSCGTIARSRVARPESLRAYPWAHRSAPHLEDLVVEPITSDQFQRASTPPPFAPLRNTVGAALGIKLPPWQEALADYFVEVGVGRKY